jgi:small subunit ribosomal protein S4e
MGRTYLKRIAAPKTWPIVRRTSTLIARPKPSGQPLELTLPLVVVLRELLGLVQNAAQVRKVLRELPVLVNGNRVHRTSSPVCFMDVLSVGKDRYRVMLDKNNRLNIVPALADEDFTLQRVRNASRVRGGKLQVHFQGGRNMLADKEEYKIGDTVAFSLEGAKAVAHYPLEPGAFVLVTGGSHIGAQGIVRKIERGLVTVDVDGSSLQTRLEYAFVLGKEKSAITIKG